MNFIYDGFRTREDAQAFGAAVLLATGNADIRLFDSQDEANRHDPFPFVLTPPIVHVARSAGDEYESTRTRRRRSTSLAATAAQRTGTPPSSRSTGSHDGAR